MPAFLVGRSELTSFNSVVRTLAYASTAIHACVGINCVGGSLMNSLYWTGVLAKTACYAVVIYFISHFFLLFF